MIIGGRALLMLIAARFSGSRSWRNPTARSMMGISGLLKAARKQQAEFEFAEPGEREVEAERVQVAEFER